MYLKIFSYQEHVILYLNPTIKNIFILLNKNNEKNIYYIICGKNQIMQHNENNIFIVKIDDNYWSYLINHNHLLKITNILF